MLSPERIGELMFRYLRHELTPAEMEELSRWRRLSAENEAFFRKETDPENIRRDLAEMYESKRLVSQKIRERFPDFPVQDDPEYPEISKGKSFSFILKFAAVFIAVLIAAWIFFPRLFTTKKLSGLNHSSGVKTAIHAGGNRATLKLSNGATLIVDSVGNGLIGSEGETRIEKKDSGELVYSKNQSSLSGEAGMNELETPRGGQFSIVLSDGTKIWLNAATRLRYPTSFTGKDRTVELQGEAYFDVAKNPKAPFRVLSGKTEVEVLGTQFDVGAYGDEPVVSTTLVEGSLRVQQDKNLVILKSGQQAQITHEGTIALTADADVHSITAWKNGKTSFTNASIQTIMRAISRWYDVEVIYKGQIPDKKFKGGLPRNTDLSDLLNVLEQSGIHFTVEGKTITVTP